MTDSLVGVQFGNYIATALVGQGTMGEVYLGRHPGLERRVAIKVLWSDLTDDAGMEARFLKEARAISSIDHPNVIEIFDLGRLPSGQPFSVMEYLDGQPLRQEMDQVGRYTEAQVLPYLRQICGGLQVTHDRGIVHRDLKPENIFVDCAAPPRLKLLDFGLVKELSGSGSETGHGVVLGTPLVIAPEQAAGRPGTVGPRSDLYSLGVIIFWMLAGRPPFDDDAPGVLLVRHLNDAPPDLGDLAPEVSPGVARLVARCPAKDPARRPASARELLRLYEQALLGADETLTPPRADSTLPISPEVEAPPAPLPPARRMDESKRPAPAPTTRRRAAAAGMLIAALALVAWVATTSTDRPPPTGSPRAAKPARRLPATVPAAAAPAPRATPPAPRADPSPVPAVREPAPATHGRPQPSSPAHLAPRRGQGRDNRDLGAKAAAYPPDRGLPRDAKPPPRIPSPSAAGEGTIDPYAYPLPGNP